MRIPYRSILACALALLGFAATAEAEAPPRGPSGVERACAGISETDRVRPLFGDRLEVVNARALRPSHGRPMEPRTMGAEVFVRAEHGMTANYVHRLAACQVALYTAAAATSGADPLAVEGAEIRVRAAGPGFVVRITAGRPSAARAIIERALSLPTGRTEVATAPVARS